MKKVWVLLLAALFLFATACTSPTVKSSPGPVPSTVSKPGKSASAKVLKPEELLSAVEATELTGYPVTMEEGSLSEDKESGVISQRYVYDINNTTIHALVQIEQNGFKPESEIKGGNTALRSFETEVEFSKDNISQVDGVADKAFTINGTGQLHMVYKDYYIVVAFDKDIYGSSKNAPLNILIGRRIITNLKEKL